MRPSNPQANMETANQQQPGLDVTLDWWMSGSTDNISAMKDN